MKLVCPQCRRTLPQIGADRVQSGDAVECGPCGHVWRLRLTNADRLERQGRIFNHSGKCGALITKGDAR